MHAFHSSLVVLEHTNS